jgi:hypothetical protein
MRLWRMPFTDAGAGRHAAAQSRDAIDKALLIGAPVQNPEGKAN